MKRTELKFFDEMDHHLCKDEKPSAYFKKRETEGLFSESYPLALLGALKHTEQNPVHHPEGNVWNHTLLVVDNAALIKSESNHPRALMWAALLHDIGKPPTTKVRRGKLTSYDHDKVGERLSKEFLQAFSQDESFIYSVSKLVRWHMQVLMIVKNLPFANIRTMVKEVPIHEIALLAMCDRLGRGEATAEMIAEEKKHIEKFIEKCKPYI